MMSFSEFSQPVTGNVGIVIRVSPGVLVSASFPVSTNIWSTSAHLLTASLNKSYHKIKQNIHVFKNINTHIQMHT